MPFGRPGTFAGLTARSAPIAMHVDGPVKVVWIREEDIQHGMYRPYWFDRVSAGLGENGKPRGRGVSLQFAFGSSGPRCLEPPALGNPKSLAAGSAAAPTVVLVHGAFADGSSWAKVIPPHYRAEQSVMSALSNQIIRIRDFPSLS